MPLSFHIEHLGLAARNPDDLAAWYLKTLDAVLCATLASNPNAYMLRFPDGTRVEIYPASEPFPDSIEALNNRRAGWRHLALKVSNLETAKEALELRGVNFSEPIKPAGGGGRVLFFADLEGNLLHLVERTADSSV